MLSKTVPTYTATIYVGRKQRESGLVFKADAARKWLQDYTTCGLCVSITETEFVYTGGNEPGLTVGLINYPRFPSSRDEIRKHAIAIAEGLLSLYQQHKVSIVFPDETLMIGDE
jgi:hypothetical protein